MKFFKGSRKNFGFTLIEIIVVIAIVAILFTISLGRYNQYVRVRQFNAAFDNLKSTIEEAQAQARAYGKDPTGYQESGSLRQNVIRDKQFLRLVRRDLGKNDIIEEFVNVYTFISAANAPMTQARINSHYKGVAVTYGNKTGPGTNDFEYDWVLMFGPDGNLHLPGLDASVNEIYIEMSTRDNTHKSRLYIDRYTGRTRIERIK